MPPTETTNLQVLFPNSFPMSMTGANLKDLKIVVAGKLKYRKASYWHQLLNMFEMLGKEYSYKIVVREARGFNHNSNMPDMTSVQKRLEKTKA